MARRLPWAREASTPSQKPKKSPTSEDQSPATHTNTPTPLTKKARRERVVSGQRIRSPSTSPPPLPPEPPKEQFMIPGVVNDDRYRLVEDELSFQAQKFTAHLHRAAYEHLKNLAKRQNAATIEAIERPVVGSSTFAAQRRHESVKRAVKQRKLLEDNGEEEDASNVLSRTMTTGSLHTLMGSPRKEAKWLATTGARGLTTRASAGFNSNSNSVSTPMRLASSRSCHPVSTTAARGAASSPIQTPTARIHSTTTTPRHTSASKGHTSSISREQSTPVRYHSGIQTSEEDDDNDDDDPFGLNKRRIRRHKSRDLRQKTEPSEPPKRKRSPDIIPSFL